MSGHTGDMSEAAASERRELASDWLTRLDASSERWESELAPVTMLAVDALLHGDARTLKEIGDPIRDALAGLFDGRGHAREARGYLLGVLALTRLGVERLPDPLAVEFPVDSHAWKALRLLAEGKPLSSNELQLRLQTSPSQVSRVGRQLLAHGLVVQRRSGRTATWEITPRGRLAVPEEPQGRRSRAR